MKSTIIPVPVAIIILFLGTFMVFSGILFSRPAIMEAVGTKYHFIYPFWSIITGTLSVVTMIGLGSIAIFQRLNRNNKQGAKET